MTSRSQPWDIPLRERLGLLKEGTHRVAYFAPKADSGSFRYRCYNMTQALNAGSKRVSTSYFFLTDLPHIDDLSDYADSLVVFRTPYDTDIDRVITRFRRGGGKVFFDIDDLVFDVRFAPLVTSNLNYKLFGKDIDQWFAFIANIGACLSLTDHVITTNTYIADRVKDFADLPVSVVPNFMNNEQIEASNTVWESRTTRKTAGLRLGYFSGSHSHAKDFAVAEKGVVDFLKGSPSSTLTVLGHLQLTPALSEVESQIRTRPFMNFIELQSAVADVDVALSPLQSSPFTFSKSELKFFESAAVGTLTLASPTPVFRGAFEHGVSGFLSGSSQWGQRLSEIEALPPEKRSDIVSTARTVALTRHTGAAQVPVLEELFGTRK